MALPDGGTRLVTRLHAVYDWHRVSTVLWMPLMEFGDFPMMRRMLRGIRQRAEGRRSGGAADVAAQSAVELVQPPDQQWHRNEHGEHPAR